MEGKSKIERMIAEAKKVSPKYEIMIRLGIETGLRISDILRLKPRHFLNDKCAIREKKTRKVKEFCISNELRVLIDEHIENFDLNLNDYLVFSVPHRRKKPLSRVQAYRIMRRSGTIAGLKSIGTHSLRKTYAKELYRSTGSVLLVQKALNHQYVDTTFRYLFDELESNPIQI